LEKYERTEHTHTHAHTNAAYTRDKSGMKRTVPTLETIKASN